jgi:hypothetical protein
MSRNIFERRRIVFLLVWANPSSGPQYFQLLFAGRKPFRRFREDGYDAVHVSEIGMERADDAVILEKARSDERVCITLDHDFHVHLAPVQ